jgi:hypothetical protein
MREPTRAYICGGATAVLYGWRRSTLDVDVRFDPQRDDVLREIPALKEELELNVELASPADFIPVIDNWESRSTFIAQMGKLSVYHFDVYAQALSKIERGNEQDVQDAMAMVRAGLIDVARLREYYDTVRPMLFRYPSIDPPSFDRAVEAFLGAFVRRPDDLPGR